MKPSARRKARFLAVQAIYQWQFDASNILEIRDQFNAKINPKKADADYFNELIFGVISNIAGIDQELTPFLNRPIAQVSLIELAILRLATFEMKFRFDIPYKVVINEALELAKEFGADAGFKYVNGVLDKIAKHLRSTEIK